MDGGEAFDFVFEVSFFRVVFDAFVLVCVEFVACGVELLLDECCVGVFFFL